MKDKRIEEYIPILGKVTVNFTSISSEVVNHFENINELERQKSINHLGLISYAFPNLSHSRYDYLILQCVLSEIIENSFRGTTSAQGSIKINKKEYRGNDVIKTWILFSNFGHCKNTIGDEKSMLMYCIEKPAFLSELIKPIKDEKLKIWARKVVERMDYVKFHHIISIYRVYKTLPRLTDVQERFISFYKLLLLPLNEIKDIANSLKVDQLKIIYKNIRNLSIISLDGRDSSLPVKLDILSTVVSFDFFLDKFQGRNLSELFNPLINLLYDRLYLAKKSQAHQRSYEVNALKQLRKKSYNEIILKGINKGISNPEICNLKSFFRIKYKLKTGEKLFTIFELSQEIKLYSKTSESSVDFNSLTRKAVVDFYIPNKGLKRKDLPSLIFGISKISMKLHIRSQRNVTNYIPLIEKIVEGFELEKIDPKRTNKIFTPLMNHVRKEIVDEAHNLNLKVYKNLLWTVIRYHLKEQYYFDVETTSNRNDYFGIKLSAEKDFLTPRIVSKKITTINDPDRIHELDHLLKSTKRKFDGIIIASLERIIIYDYSLAPSKRKVTDIDSVVLKFNTERLIIEFNETKNTRKPVKDAKKDIKVKFVKVLNRNSFGYRVLDEKNYGIKLRIKHGT